MNNYGLNLLELLNNCINDYTLSNIYIKKIVLDSRQIKGKHCLFLAIKGYKLDGKIFINDAIKNGAVAVITYSDNKIQPYNIIFKNNIPIIFIPNLKEKISFFAGKLYNNPSYKIPVIGVTGTNGKTSVTNFLMQWINLLGKKAAVCSTLGNGFYNNLLSTNNTTDSAIEIQYQLKNFIEQKADIAIIEVSSHGLKQFRISNLKFEIGIFTNLSRDHLDYHLNMEDYELTKWKFFSEHKINKNIINIDDIIGFNWLKKLSYKKTIAVTTKKNIYLKNNLYFKVTKINFFKKNTIIKFNSSWGKGTIKIFLIGYFNVINIILSMTALLTLNFNLKDIINTSTKLHSVHGRMEAFPLYKNYPTIIIDYAHTPNALKNILLTIKLYCKNKIWCIFGCGGERDVGKRSIMGIIAKNFSDIVIITTDNPRSENIIDIVNDIIKEYKNKNNLHIILNRLEAIHYAISHADKNDTILIAGKGHEQYQIIGNKIFNYSDYNVVNNFFKKIFHE
ncbi:UDP-N-acetylmuramoyl-L-alanyl-D-glutamate--2,6-diaminopimelate ligase [Enterobacteriaceae endosymbiont of Plateumaris consimilis]|uniref:UDP-N-acetylmuramoyl-L-alanyl-D-glutamate--2, 6-diaminopimelate ligase n=1 Tax=Enterobacteriaceae endosymbiont of Plateumaris consimilis TaxID=2675794 RepID=UPI001448D46E|nr:UDP-N-acetylmuramoyl-L-alanyl-D-glutamate--2,6-diaminopimelate ligase [Enterobacteriaceae endosymbiont of Plateumaris consimilis]QJC28551.1 UDP-N-acetylmuramoyl-L-alanyl-D-glutamate--2,6-diaminopimelate ligase [Enterobacteriaceae endosymbiont of Plateumaris consimilis]